MKTVIAQEKQRPRILIIDATEPGTSLGEEIASPLKGAGFDVARTCGYPESPSASHASNPDMVILDEAVNGSMQLCHQYAGAGIPVILVGKDTSQEIWNSALVDAGADFYFIRPISPEVLTARIKAILRRYKRRGNRYRAAGGDFNVEKSTPIPVGPTGTIGILPSLTNLRQMIRDIVPHKHLGLIYESLEEWRAAVIPFMAVGLERNEKCIYIVSDQSADQIRAYLGQENVDVASVERSGQLLILHESQAYTMQVPFEPDRMIDSLISETEKAIGEGYSGLRGTGEMSWALHEHADVDRLLQYEARVNQDVFPKHPCSGICQYDRRKFNPELIKGVVMTHPLLVTNNQIYSNSYYISPQDFLGEKRAEMEVQHWLNNLERERRIQKTQDNFVKDVLAATTAAAELLSMQYKDKISEEDAAQTVDSPLTLREIQVLNLIATGRTNKQIGKSLQLHEQTVKHYVSAMLRKLNANDRAHAVAIAMKRHWLSAG